MNDKPSSNPAKKAQDLNEYSASDANKGNQKENAQPSGKKPREGKDPASGAARP